MTARVEATRAQILEFFRASPEEYEVIFTPNATGALRLVGESYPFGPGGRYLLTFDNHNSVNGIRQFARASGASVTTCPSPPPTCASPRRRWPATSRPRPRSPAPFRPPALRLGHRQLVRLPGPVQLLRRPAPPGLDRPGPGRRVRRAAGRRRFRADQPAGSVPVAPGLRIPVVLQDLRLPDRDRGPAGAQAGAGQATPPVVRRRHDHLLLGTRRSEPPARVST